jgi:23S rRNA pseudouridine2605 synthase
MVFKKPGNSRDDKSNKPAARRTGNGDQPRNTSPRTRNANSGFKKADDGAPKKRFGGDADKKPYGAARKSSAGGFGSSSNRKPYGDKPFRKDSAGGDDRPFRKDSAGGDRPFRKSTGGDGFKSDRPSTFRKRTEGGDERPSFGGNKRAVGSSRKWSDKPTDTDRNRPFRERGDRPANVKARAPREDYNEEAPNRTMRGRNKKAAEAEDSHLIRLNRYISNAGICSRRKADELIIAGVVSVNGEVISELGYKVDPSKDVIRYNGETLKREKMVYVLLNKPKDYITTTDDPQERRTVMQLVDKASKERIYPVGRLDRNTTGLILMTNDGDLADKLSHPRNSVTKIYHVELNKSLTQGDLNKIEYGLELEDGPIKPDMVSYVQGGTKREVGIQIHSGKNRIVRRIFEHLGYEVVKLDRTIYANLTKKDLPRGRWRYLDEKEIIQLKHLVKA